MRKQSLILELNNITPKQFAHFHGHSGYSPYDGLGYPIDYFVYAEQNGLDNLVFTEHGNMNSFADAYLGLKNLKNGISIKDIRKTSRNARPLLEGRDDSEILRLPDNFKYLKGVEFYFHPSLQEWEAARIAKANMPKAEDHEGGVSLEDEEESKSFQSASDILENTIRRRHHLVAVAKTNKGLENLFSLVSLSYKKGFYRFPRIDFDMLKQYGEDIILSTACLAGFFSYEIYKFLEEEGMDTNSWNSEEQFKKYCKIKNVDIEGLSHAQILKGESQLGINRIKDVHLNKILNKFENYVDRFVDCVGKENFFLELQFNKLPHQHVLNYILMELSKKTGVQNIVTVDYHYPNPDLWKSREVYKLLKWAGKKDVSEIILPESKDELKCELYPKNAEQIWNSYKETTNQYSFYDDQYVCDAIERTHDIAFQHIEDVDPDKSVKIRSYPLSEGVKSSFEELVLLCKKGLQKKNLHKDKKYIDRLKTELKVIRDKKFEKYFLNMADMCKHINKHMLMGHGRGSGAGGLVNYLLEITHLDPLKYDLLFERFLDPSRDQWPDLDCDAADKKKVLEILKKEYGEDNVVPISNFNRLKFKSLIKDLARLNNIPFEEVNYVTKMIDSEDTKQKIKNGTGEKIHQGQEVPYELALEYCEPFREFMEKYDELSEHLDALYMQNRSLGRHAGGVLIADNLLNKMPVISARGEMQTPWAEGQAEQHLEPLGWIKFDLLGLETLPIIQKCIELILKKEGNNNPTFDQVRKWYDEKLHPDILDLSDQAVYEKVYQGGNFCGTFQFTKAPVQGFIQKLRPTSIEEIAAATAIFRPGPMDAGVPEDYLKTASGKVSPEYDHPILEKILKPTYGFMIFQEQMMQILNQLADIPLGDCYKAIKAVSKKKHEVIEKLGKTFMENSVKNGLSQANAEKWFDKIKVMAGYAFNKCLHEDSLVETKEGIKKIKDVEVGDYVNSRNSFVKVKDKISNGKKRVVKIKTRSGKELICTLDHKLETEEGMRTVKEIIARKLKILCKK